MILPRSVLVSALLMLSCGGADGGPSTSPSASFLGTYACEITETSTLPKPEQGQPVSHTDSRSISLIQGRSADEIVAPSDDGSCDLSFRVEGNVASLMAGAECTIGGVVQVYAGGTLTLSGSHLSSAVEATSIHIQRRAGNSSKGRRRVRSDDSLTHALRGRRL